jgi:putative transposase
VLTEPIQARLKELLDSKAAELKCEILEMEIMSDHVHLLLDVCPQIGIDKVVGRLKGYTSFMLRNEFPELKRRLPSLWTRSKFISTVGSVSLDSVKKYIEDQKGV